MERLRRTESNFAQPTARDETGLAAGARNLLEVCAGLEPGQNVLILHEDPALGWFDMAAPIAVAKMAEALGADVHVLQVGGPDTPLPTEYLSARWRADVEIWFARIGDQDRFKKRDSGPTKVVSYARTASALASSFGTRPHAEMLDLKQKLDHRISVGQSIHVKCPLGTDLRGTPGCFDESDVTVKRFPMCVPSPVPANSFSGTVMLSGYLTPTGSRSYDPASLFLAETVMANIDNGRITGFDGCQGTIERVNAHYSHVSSLFDIDPMIVHSWHAGIHDGCSYHGTIEQNPDLWSNTVFGSPQWLHFHTCGDYAPGEICWMVKDPTIIVDDTPLWSNGVLAF